MTTQTPAFGRSADDILEGEAGGLSHRAVALVELGSALEFAGEEFKYDDGDLPTELTRRCAELAQFVERLSLDVQTALLTLNRECPRCSGNGHSTREDPCTECEGRGFIAQAPEMNESEATS